METMAILPERVERIDTAPIQTPVVTNLAGFVRKRFTQAQEARVAVEQRMLEDLRQARSQYAPAKLEAIRQMMGALSDPPYIGVTESKMGAIHAWLIDAVLPPGRFPANIEPTPVPELPDFMVQQIEQKISMEVQAQVEQLARTGQIVNQATFKMAYDQLMEMAKDDLDHEIMEEARKSARKLLDEVRDQFAEGGWEEAFKESLYDLLLGTAIMRGPVLKSVPARRSAMDPVTQQYQTTYSKEIISTWERMVPLRFYPAPQSTRKSVPWYVYVNSMTPTNLSDMLDDPEADQAAVQAAIDLYGNGHREVSSVEGAKTQLENRNVTDNDGLIDRLEYGGEVPGRLLVEWGMTDLDPRRVYDSMVYIVGGLVVKVVLNPDPVGLGYIFSAGFTEIPDSFWGVGVPRKMRHSQNICNIAARAIVMNMGIASGPLTEVNMDRMWPGENFTMTPFKVLRSTNAMMQEGKAVNFYQPTIVTQRLIEVFQWGEDVADRETGIPRVLYAGESRTPTATANSMLMSQAAKGGQAVIRNIDAGLIVPAVQAQVNYIMQYESGKTEYFGDLRVVAQGSNSQVAAETKVMRLKELLQESSANPIDQAIFDVEVRSKLWAEAIKALGLDPRLLGEEDEIEARAQQIQMQQMMMAQQPQQIGDGGGPPRPGSKPLEASGAPTAGRDTQQFESPKGSKP